MTSYRLCFGCVGLGPNFLGPLRYLLPYNKKYHIAARFHDIGFERGGTEEDKKRVDNMFLKLMLSVSNSPLQKWFAGLYYKLVSKYGKYFFNYKVTYEI